MARFTDVEERVESRSERRVRYFLAVILFLQTVVTAIPFLQGWVEIDGQYREMTITAFNLLINPNGYGSFGAMPLALIGGVLVIFPIVAFFFCVLDSKSRVKFFVSGACSIVTAIIITFCFSSYISIGAVITLVLDVICLFMSSQGIQAVMIRKRNQA